MMAIKIEQGQTPEQLAQILLGDSRLTGELVIPGWRQGLPLPVGQMAYLRGEPLGPPARNWTKPRSGGGQPNPS